MQPDPQPVYAGVSGTVRELCAAPGSAVQAGELVAIIEPAASIADPTQLRNALQQREESLARARDAYLHDKQRAEGGLLSEEDLAPVQQAFTAAQEARNSTLAALESAQREKERLRHYAPCAGRVVSRAVSTGDPVRPGTPILYIQASP